MKAGCKADFNQKLGISSEVSVLFALTQAAVDLWLRFGFLRQVGRIARETGCVGGSFGGGQGAFLFE